jgi:ssDNA-binding Zn-finger/Zn-ribbon topoisomerase 1
VRTREARRMERVLRFRQCPSCSYDLATREGERGCHYYDCPYLPEELDVTCPRCRYNFFTDDGNPGCVDPPACKFARKEAPQRVDTLRRWLRIVR